MHVPVLDVCALKIWAYLKDQCECWRVCKILLTSPSMLSSKLFLLWGLIITERAEVEVNGQPWRWPLSPALSLCSPVKKKKDSHSLSLCEEGSLNHYRKMPYKLLEALHFFILRIYTATNILFMHFLCIIYMQEGTIMFISLINKKKLTCVTAHLAKS